MGQPQDKSQAQLSPPWPDQVEQPGPDRTNPQGSGLRPSTLSVGMLMISSAITMIMGKDGCIWSDYCRWLMPVAVSLDGGSCGYYYILAGAGLLVGHQLGIDTTSSY